MNLFKRKNQNKLDLVPKSLFEFSGQSADTQELVDSEMEKSYLAIQQELPKYQRESFTREEHKKLLIQQEWGEYENRPESIWQGGLEVLTEQDPQGVVPSEIVDQIMTEFAKPQNYKLRQEMRLSYARGKIYKKTQAWQASAIKQMAYFLTWCDVVQKSAKMGELQITIEAKGITNCDTYLWTQETLELAQSMPSPHHLLMDEHLLSSPSMFMVFEQPLFIVNLKGEVGACSWIMVCVDSDMISVSHDVLSHVTPENSVYTELPRGDERIITWEFDLNTIYPLELNSDYHGVIPVEHQQLGLEFVLKLLCFLKTKAAEIEHRVTERSFRREMKRENIEVEPEETRVVRLRKVTYRGETVPVGDGTKKTIRWKGQWWVQGHWRNQAYGPNMSLRKAKWIPTYSKGNKTAPFIEKTFLVER